MGLCYRHLIRGCKGSFGTLPECKWGHGPQLFFCGKVGVGRSESVALFVGLASKMRRQDREIPGDVIGGGDGCEDNSVS